MFKVQGKLYLRTRKNRIFANYRCQKRAKSTQTFEKNFEKLTVAILSEKLVKHYKLVHGKRKDRHKHLIIKIS